MGTRALVGRYIAPSRDWEAVYFSHDGYPSGLGQILLDEVRAWSGDLDGLLSELLDPTTDAPGGLRGAEFQTDSFPEASNPLFRQDNPWVGDTNYLYLFDVGDRRLDVISTSDYFEGKAPLPVRFFDGGIADVVELREPLHPVVFVNAMEGWGDESAERKAERIHFANNVARTFGTNTQSVAKELFAFCEKMIRWNYWASHVHPLPPRSERWRQEWNPIILATGWFEDGVYDLPIGSIVLHYGGSNTARQCEIGPHSTLHRLDGAISNIGLIHVSSEWPDDLPTQRYRDLLNVLCQCALEAILGPESSIDSVEWRLEDRWWRMRIWQEISATPRPGQLSLEEARTYASEAEEGDTLLRWEMDVTPHVGRWKWLVLDWMRMVARGEAVFPNEE